MMTGMVLFGEKEEGLGRKLKEPLGREVEDQEVECAAAKTGECAGKRSGFLGPPCEPRLSCAPRLGTWSRTPGQWAESGGPSCRVMGL